MTRRWLVSISKIMRQGPTRRRNNPRYSPFKAVVSPENGSPLLCLGGMLTGCRSLGGNPRTAPPAALLSAKPQFTLEVFEADILSASKFPATALDRVNLVGLSLVDRDYTF